MRFEMLLEWGKFTGSLEGVRVVVRAFLGLLGCVRGVSCGYTQVIRTEGSVFMGSRRGCG